MNFTWFTEKCPDYFPEWLNNEYNKQIKNKYNLKAWKKSSVLIHILAFQSISF